MADQASQQPLDQRDSIRRRPGMYIGSGDAGGVVRLVLEVLSNALDQHLAGRCTRIHVGIDGDDTITVEDDGPGIPVGPVDGTSFLERVLGLRHTTGTADGHAPHVHLACGVGLAVANALSEEMQVRVVRDGAEHRIGYREGLPIAPLASAPCDAPTGTRVRFRPDRTIFATTRVPRVALSQRLEELSFLSPGLALTWSFAGDHQARRGLAGLVEQELWRPFGPTVQARGEVDGIAIDVAFGWHERHPAELGPPVLHSFVNLERTRAHGTHVAGLLRGLRALGANLDRDQRQIGLVAAVSVILTDVLYGNPTKDKLVSPAVHPAVAAITSAALRDWIAAHPAAAERVVEQARRLADESRARR